MNSGAGPTGCKAVNGFRLLRYPGFLDTPKTDTAVPEGCLVLLRTETRTSLG